jgi:hypothetical protein
MCSRGDPVPTPSMPWLSELIIFFLLIIVLVHGGIALLLAHFNLFEVFLVSFVILVVL